MDTDSDRLQSDDISEKSSSTKSSNKIIDNAVYKEACRRLQVVPSSRFMRTISNNEHVLNLKHCGLSAKDMNAISTALVRNLGITELCLSDNRLGKDGARHVADMLTENVSIVTLDISDNNIGSEGARMVCDMIAENNSLTSLNLSGNDIKNQDGMYFSDLLRSPRSGRLIDLNLSHNHIEESGGQQLALAIKHNRWLKTLNLSWNHIRRKGANSICKALKLNDCLMDVDLSWNGLGDEGAVLVAEVLQENTALRSFSVAYNRFSIKGINLITEGLRRNNTLQIFRVGGNMVTHAGSMDLLTVLETNVDTSIVTLDLGDSPVKKEFIDLLDELTSERPELNVIYGRLVRDFDLYAILARGRNKHPVNPVLVLRDYIVENGLRCHDLFYRFDENKDQIVTRTEFRRGILGTGLPLSAAERGRLYRRIDRKTRGFIEYKDFADVFEERVRNERRRRVRAKLEPREPTPQLNSDDELLA
ncbi:leucine-rich repeat-containing protein 74B-like isoform X2 [Ptychodera flava]